MDEVEYAEIDGDCARFGWHDGPSTINPEQRRLRVPDDAGRFDDPSCEYGLLYCAESEFTALVEVLGQVAREKAGLMDRIAQETGAVPDYSVDYRDAIEKELADHRMATFDLREIELLDLRSAVTQGWIDRQVSGSSRDRLLPSKELASSDDRGMTQRVGSFLVRRLGLAGLAWESDRVPGTTCLALVGVPGEQPVHVPTPSERELSTDDEVVRDALAFLGVEFELASEDDG